VKEPKDPLKPLRKIADSLAYAERAVKLLHHIWDWYGPYGIRHVSVPPKVLKKIESDPELLAAYRALLMPDDLHNRLRDFYNFDDSE
jgi:hypothetical protein